VETTDAPDFASAVDAAATDLVGRLATRSRSVTTHVLTPATPATPL
jgi:hypothetical protein